MNPVKKRKIRHHYTVKPFPINEVAYGLFTGLDVEIFDQKSIKLLTNSGSYGFTSRPRQTIAKSFDKQPIILFPEEAFFLHNHIKCLMVRDIDDKIISADDLWKEYCGIKENFVDCYVAYLYFKSKNWVVKVGTKFGGNFLLYKHSPTLYHATFVVRVVNAKRSCYEHQSLERISETTKKCMIYLEVTHPDGIDSSEYLHHLDKFKVKEIAVKRLDIKER